MEELGKLDRLEELWRDFCKEIGTRCIRYLSRELVRTSRQLHSLEQVSEHITKHSEQSCAISGDASTTHRAGLRALLQDLRV